MTASTARPAVVRYQSRTRPVAVERASVAWWLAFGCWFACSVLAQFAGGPATMVVPYPYAHLQPGPSAVVFFGLYAFFLASLVLPLRDGARWSRPLLTVFGLPMAAVLAWQFGRSILADAPTVMSVSQAVLSSVALAAVPVAVGLMYRSDVRGFFTSR